MPAVLPINVVRHQAGATPLGDLVRDFARREAAWIPPSHPVALIGNDVVDLLAAAAWLAASETDGLVIDRERATPAVRALLSERGFRLINLGGASPPAPAALATPRPGRISLLTSGTTDTPKLIEHTWTSLFTLRAAKAPRPLNWLVTYAPGTYAWFQMVTLGLFVAGQSLTVAEDRSPAALFEAASRQGVTAISATPTFWRMALLQIPRPTLATLPLEQLTLGGECVDQPILDRLRALFPCATITHIYASSEAGACIVVSDGREGFPAAWLAAAGDPADGGPQMQLRDGVLWLRSPHASQQHAGWFSSGDAAQRIGDRVVLLGRIDRSQINVGGMKLATADVERALLQHPAVQWCRVYGRRAPIVGELVTADVVCGSDARTSAADLTRFCAARLPAHMIPRWWNFLPDIPATANFKTPTPPASP